jgi:vacuolar protein sorting-associated protein 13A/C
MGSQKPVAGSAYFAQDYKKDTPTPFMFSFPNDDRRDRLLLRVDDSRWSQPLSFEPSSADMQIVMPSQNGKREYYVGLSYAEGLGKYKLSKVITIAPRFLFKNMCTAGLLVRQTGEAQPLCSVPPDERRPLLYLAPQPNNQEVVRPQIRIAFDTPNTGLKWSAPFYINDIGKTHVRLSRTTSRGATKEYLMRIETHLEGSCIFLYVSRETDPWPIIIKNETNVPFKFKQTVSSCRTWAS